MLRIANVCFDEETKRPTRFAMLTGRLIKKLSDQYGSFLADCLLMLIACVLFQIGITCLI